MIYQCLVGQRWWVGSGQARFDECTVDSSRRRRRSHSMLALFDASKVVTPSVCSFRGRFELVPMFTRIDE
jgi:hypothetical protein